MLLAIDIGNTQTIFGLFKGGDIVGTLRIATDINKTADEYQLIIEPFLKKHLKKKKLSGIAISNVVPPLLWTFETLSDALSVRPLIVRPGIKTGMAILYDNPLEVGADRIVNAVAVSDLYRTPAIVVDFGTATTFDVITEKREYAGGVIAPGLSLSAEALFQHAARLPRVELSKPSKIVATNTIESIQAGLFHGYAGLVKGILQDIQAERGEEHFIVATGGLAHIIAPNVPAINTIDPDLTLKGLHILYEKNTKHR